jgi:hypothetical protein
MYCAQGGGEVSHTEQEELDTAMDMKQLKYKNRFATEAGTERDGIDS